MRNLLARVGKGDRGWVVALLRGITQSPTVEEARQRLQEAVVVGLEERAVEVA